MLNSMISATDASVTGSFSNAMEFFQNNIVVGARFIFVWECTDMICDKSDVGGWSKVKLGVIVACGLISIFG